MKHSLILLFSLLLLTACGMSQEEQSKHDEQVAKKARMDLLREIEENKTKTITGNNEDGLSKIGIRAQNGIITIDTNKTQIFFEEWGKKMQGKVETLTKEMKEEFMQNTTGIIETNKTSIIIDVNKTEHFLDKLGEKMQGFAQEMEALSIKFQKNMTIKDHNATD